MLIRKFSQHALASSLVLGCALYQSSCRTKEKKKEPTSEIDATDSVSKAAPPQKNSEADSLAMGRQKELEALMASAPKEIDIDKYWKDAGYNSIPSRIFMAKSNDKASGARYLTGISIAIYEQALAGKITRDNAHYGNSLALLSKIIETDLNFANDPALKGCQGDNDSVQCTNDNRYLASAWAISSMARAARIIDLTAPQDWKNAKNWEKVKGDFISWFEFTSKSRDNPKVKPWATLIQHAGTMTWVSPTDSKGSTNRTFALLEAQMRMAELRGGQMIPGRGMQNIFGDFKNFLKTYFTREEKCKGDPKTGAGKNLACLVNKDEDRYDTYHPLMGLASIGYIVEIGKRNNLHLEPNEREMILKGYRWGADWNTIRIESVAQKGKDRSLFAANEINSGIDVWETAYRAYSVDEMGPLCLRDRDRNRSSAANKKAGLAWGYGIIAEGF